VSTAEDHAADRRLAISIGALVVAEVTLAGLADGGVIAVWLWSVLAVVAVGLAAALAALLGRTAAP
jgi:hypothetical protein